MTGRLKGKVAVVTGASSGIGLATARRFVAEGAKVMGTARSRENLEKFVSDLGDVGDVVAIEPADLASEEDANRVIDAAHKRFGKVDILVNCAGVGYNYRSVRPGSMDALADTSMEDWNHTLAIDLGSVVHCSRRAIQLMMKDGGGSIINVSSILGLVGQPDAHAYTTAKGAIINLTRSLAITYAKSGIRVNTVCPGYIETPMVEEYREQLNSEEYRYQWNPMGRMGVPDEIASGVLFLASDEASYCNGALLTIDGGQLSMAPS